MAKSPNWTEVELDNLSQYYPVYGATEKILEYFPGRTLKGINVKACRENLKVLNPWNKQLNTLEYNKQILSRNIQAIEKYTLAGNRILHKCLICDTEWLATPNNIKNSNSGCPACTRISVATSNTLSIQEVDKTLLDSGYERLSEYTHSKVKMTVQHISCGYVWDVIYNHIQRGHGCPLCNVGFGYSHNKDNMPIKATIYLFKITTNKDSFFKIGVTSIVLNCRKSQLTYHIPNCVSIELIHSHEDSGITVLKKEQLILSSFEKYKYSGKFPGSTELLTLDSDINLIKEIMNKDITHENI